MTTDPGANEPALLQERPPRRRRWRRIWLGIGAVLVLILIVEGLTLLRMRGDLVEGRNQLNAAKRALVAGDASGAAHAFEEAHGAFGRAEGVADGALGRVSGAIPWVGNTVDAARALATAGNQVASAGGDLATALVALPGGVAALAPSDGVIPVERYAALGEGVQHAAAQTEAAANALDAAPDTFVPRAVSKAVWDAQDQIGQLARQLGGAAALLEGAGAFAGETQPSRYLVVSSNPGELRGTGGIWGGYTIVTIDNGRVEISRTRPTEDLKDFPAGRVPSPSEDYARNYDQYGGAGSWQNMNATPDFPSAAQAALANYARGERARLDGVIAVDPFAVRELLAATGPVTLANGLRVDADNVIALTTNRVYQLLPNAPVRTEIVGEVAAVALRRFLAADDRGLSRLRRLAGTVADGHMRIYSVDPTVQQGLSTLGVDGALGAPTGDAFGVTVNNGSGSKIDFYATRTVTYDVTLGGDHEAIASAEVTIQNDAPTSGQPRYVIGPYLRTAEAGDQIPLTTLWCHAPCSLAAAARDGQSTELATGTENGFSWLRDYRTIPAGDSGTLSATWRVTDAWEGDATDGSYRLTLFGQTTIRPTRLTVTIRVPDGSRVVWTSEPMEVDGRIATWMGPADATRQLSVRFRAPLPSRLYRDITRLFGG